MGICSSKEHEVKLPNGAVKYSSMNSNFVSGGAENLTPRKRPEKADQDTPSSMKESREDVMMSDNRIIDEFRGRQLKRPSDAYLSSSELYSDSDELEEEKDENYTGEDKDKKISAIRGMSGLKLVKRAEKKMEKKRDIEKDIREAIEEYLRGPGREMMTPEEIEAEVQRREKEYRMNQEARRKKRIARELAIKEKEAEEAERIKNEFKNKLTDMEKEKKLKSEMNRKLYEERLLNESKQNEESEEYKARKREQIQKLEEERLLKEEARRNVGSIRLPGAMAERSPLLVEQIKRAARLKKENERKEAERKLNEANGIVSNEAEEEQGKISLSDTSDSSDIVAF